MEKAIKYSIEGGWRFNNKLKIYDLSFKIIRPEENDGLYKFVSGGHTVYMDVGDFLFDPLFWNSLGKALGHEKEMLEFIIWSSVKDSVNKCWWWEAQWHMFTDHLIAGKDPEEFFINLFE